MQECPNCGGELSFDIATQRLKCPFCDGLFDPSAMPTGKAADEAHYRTDEAPDTGADQALDVTPVQTIGAQAGQVAQDLQSPPLDAQQSSPQEAQYLDVIEYTCPQCGGSIYSTEESVNGFCSYCGSNHMLSSRLAKMPAPRGVIPFQITKEQCKQAYLEKVGKAFFAPHELKDPAYLEHFRGIYIPYWVYDIDYHSPVNLPATRTYRRGDYIYTERYTCSCYVESYYKGISYDASSSFDDHFSETIAPYNVRQMMQFSPTYLAGYYADLQDVDWRVYAEDAVGFVQTQIIQEVTGRRVFPNVSLDLSATAAIQPGLDPSRNVSIAFQPVWFLAYKNRDRVAYAVVNGQTGKLSCDLPVDNKKFLLFAGVLALPLYALLLLLPTMTPKVMLLFADIVALLAVWMLTDTVKKVNIRDQRMDDKGYQSKYSGAKYYELRQKRLKKANQEKQKPRDGVKLFSLIFFFAIVTNLGMPAIAALFALIGSGGLSIPVAAAALVLFVLGMKHTHAAERRRLGLVLGYVAILCALLLSAVIMIANPTDDIVFYGSVVLVLISIVVSQIFAMKEYNLLTTRPLPQLARQGGDTSAPV